MSGLFAPIQVRGLTIKNRIVMPPMGTNKATLEGAVTDFHLEHYPARARAGVGTIIVEHAYVTRLGRLRTNQLGVWDDALVPGLRRLVEEVHAAGAAICLQLNHAGAKADPAIIGQPPVGASAVAVPGGETVPRALERGELAGLAEAFALAATRAVAAGFDAVEVHGAHGYLLSQFASPLTNHRQDEYGGDARGRFRFPVEVLRAVRARIPESMPLFYRLAADELLPGGVTPDEAEAVLPELLATGLDVVDVSGGLGGAGIDIYTEQGFFVPLANRLKRASGAVVVGVGNVRDPQYADRVVREGLVDFLAVGRAQLQDAEWAARAAEALGVARG